MKYPTELEVNNLAKKQVKNIEHQLTYILAYTHAIERENERLQARSNELDKALFHLDEVLNHAVSKGIKHITVVNAEKFIKPSREWRDEQRRITH